MEVILANPRGFCAGVERAIAIVERALERFGAPIYVRHEVVHNKFVVDGLRAKGELPGVVSRFDAQQVTVDFNHPLAGKVLTFEVEILDVKAA